MRNLLWPLAGCLSLMAHPALAQVPPPTPQVPLAEAFDGSADGPVQLASTLSLPQDAKGIAALDVDELAGLNGRQGSTSTILSDQDLTAINRGNSITAHTVSTGGITLGPGAFEGFAGVGNFVINSGNNNNLQGALTINIIGQ